MKRKKRKTVMIVFIIGSIFLSACGKNGEYGTKMEQEPEGPKAADLAVIKEPEETYDGERVSCMEIEEGYKVVLYDKMGEEVFSIFYPKEPDIKEIESGVWEIKEIGNPFYAFCYREEDSRISEIFYSPIFWGDGCVAYMEDGSLILQDIFSEGLLDVRLERDFTKMEKADKAPIDAVEHIKRIDNETIEIVYYSGEDSEKRTTLLNIDGSMEKDEGPGIVYKKEKESGFQAGWDEVGHTLWACVRIEKEEGYARLLEFLESIANDEKFSLGIDMSDTDIRLYLDEIFSRHKNIENLVIKNGGVLAIKNSSASYKNVLECLELDHIRGVEGDILAGADILKRINVTIDWHFEGGGYLGKILEHTECKNIALVYDDDDESSRSSQILSEELAYMLVKEEELVKTPEKENRYLGMVFRLNREGYSYTSYEFYQNFNGVDDEDKKDCHPHVFIDIENRKQGSSYMQEIPVSAHIEIIKPSVADSSHERMYLEDINFDGREDLIFAGNCVILDMYNMYGYLWNPDSRKYEWCPTVPDKSWRVDEDRKRLKVSGDVFGDIGQYCIYEYEGGRFQEKCLDVMGGYWRNGYEYWIVWNYYEDRELLAILIWRPDIVDGPNYTYTNLKTGESVSGQFLSGDDGLYNDLGYRFFPEFDFYIAG